MSIATQTSAPHELGEVIFDEAAIAEAVARIAAAVKADFAGAPIVMVPILKGALLFSADLMRALGDYPVTIDFMVVSSYGTGRNGTTDVRLLKDLDQNPAGKNILLVEDIIDEGYTLSYLLGNIRSRDPQVVRACALIDKPFHRAVDVQADYVGLRAPDGTFLVGYGLDFQERFRNLPHIRQLQSRVPT